MRRSPDDHEAGQALVEFSLAITVFLLLVMGTVDLGRAVYQYNGVTEAARQLARVASVHPGATLGSSDESSAAFAIQQGMVPGLGTPTYSCTDIAGAPVSGTCQAGDWVRVAVASTFNPATPLATVLGQVILTSTAAAKIE